MKFDVEVIDCNLSQESTIVRYLVEVDEEKEIGPRYGLPYTAAISRAAEKFERDSKTRHGIDHKNIKFVVNSLKE